MIFLTSLMRNRMKNLSWVLHNKQCLQSVQQNSQTVEESMNVKFKENHQIHMNESKVVHKIVNVQAYEQPPRSKDTQQ